MQEMDSGGLADSNATRQWVYFLATTSNYCKPFRLLWTTNHLVAEPTDLHQKGPPRIHDPPRSHSHMRPASRQSLRSFQSYVQDLNTSYRPSSSAGPSGRRTPLHTARSMTSMSQYRDSQPQYSGRSPSPAFHAVQGRYDVYDDQDEELNYPVDNIGYSYDPRDSHTRNRSVSPRPRSIGGMPPSIRQTPSPLRWAMQDLMNSLDTMNPQMPFSPLRDSYENDIMYDDQQSYDPRGYPTDAWSQPERFEEEHARTRYSGEIIPPYMYPADMRPPPLLNYVDKMQSKLDRLQNYHYSPQRDAGDLDREERSPSRISNFRPHSSHSVEKPLPTSSFQPPIPPPHVHRHRETESIASHSTKHSIFSTTASDYSTVASSASTGSAGSAGSFARKKQQLLRQEQEANQRDSIKRGGPKIQFQCCRSEAQKIIWIVFEEDDRKAPEHFPHQASSWDGHRSWRQNHRMAKCSSRCQSSKYSIRTGTDRTSGDDWKCQKVSRWSVLSSCWNALLKEMNQPMGHPFYQTRLSIYQVRSRI